ncbi:flagellar hook-basal body complex protein FliE [Desulforhabdus sp. TSK]|uniref:flagellar hook-basal body complex protein FliE n=1 Tax=Desulforhabdus sp. TSK TaxID=2925014 RepID=UPI0020810385|nr:flagellar hook-basal body complex protein FliE [Desulforhabdus sp. TSK]GKT07390.1 hypothetical protein DSTSK_06950 [Desulforhabdus sp. TSK]
MTMTPVSLLPPAMGKAPAAPTREVQEGPSSGFGEMLKTKIMEVDQLQQGADEAMRKGAVAGATNIHETMVQLEEADIGMRMLLKVRDKALSAYQEIMRMQF